MLIRKLNPRKSSRTHTSKTRLHASTVLSFGVCRDVHQENAHPTIDASLLGHLLESFRI